MKKNNFQKKWKTATCGSGAKCWCRLVVTKDYTRKADDLKDCIIRSGEADKKLAQYIVKLHNNNLEEKNE